MRKRLCVLTSNHFQSTVHHVINYIRGKSFRCSFWVALTPHMRRLHNVVNNLSSVIFFQVWKRTLTINEIHKLPSSLRRSPRRTVEAFLLSFGACDMVVFLNSNVMRRSSNSSVLVTEISTWKNLCFHSYSEEMTLTELLD